MKNRVNAFIAAAVLVCLIPAASFAIAPYAQDFEGLVQADPAALTNDGWLIFGNVFDAGGGYLYGYGVFGAPNDGAAFCAIDAGQGGASQGLQQLAVFSDYNNVDHAAGNLIEANVFQEMTIGAGDVGNTWTFEFDAKRGNIEGQTTAIAFIKTLNPANGYETTNFITYDTTNLPDTWGTYFLQINIDATLVDQLLQIGFSNTATLYQGSGIFYDNIDFYMGVVGTEEMTFGGVKSLFR